MENLPGNVTDILERISEAFVSLDKDWCYTYMNKKAGEIFNRDPAKMIGRHIWSEFPEGIGQPFHKAYEKAMVEQNYIFLEEYYPPYDKWFENHIYPSPDGLSIFFLDITQRKKTEHFNKKVQKEYEALINNTSDLLWSVSRDYTLIAANKAFVNGLKENGGFEIKPGEGILSTEHFPDNYIQYWKEVYDKGLSGKSLMTEVYTPQANSSEYLWFELKIEPIKDENGVTGIACSMRNISERRKAEDIIKKEKELSDSIINSLPGIFYMSDTTPKLLRWNKALEDYSGYTSEELGKIRPINLFVPEDHAALKQEMEKAYKEGFGKAETQLVNKNGEKVPFYFTGVGIEHDGKPAMLGTGINITERKKTDAALKKSIERFELMAETTNDALWEWNLETNELWANKMHQQLYGLTPADPVPYEKEWEQRIHPDDRARIMAMKNEALASTKKLWDSEYRFQTWNRSYIDIYDRSYIVRNENGKPIRIMGSMMDISQLKKNDKILAENENYLRTILQTEPECVKILSPNGEVLYMNPAGLAMIEAENLEMIKGHKVRDLVNGEYRNSFSEITKNVFLGKTETLEFEITGLKGTKRWLETHAVPLKNAEGEIVSLLGVTRDITKNKKTEEAIKKSEKLYRNLFENLLHGFGYFKVIFKNDRAEDMIFLNCNKEYEKILGVENITGKKMSELLPGLLESDPTYKDLLTQVGFHEEKLKFETFVKTLGKWLSVTIYGVEKEHCVSLVEDVSERKKAEEKIKESEEHALTLFNHSAVLIWEEDFSDVKKFAEELKEKGVNNLNYHLSQNHEDLIKAASLIRVKSINEKSKDFYGVSSEDELVQNIPAWFLPESWDTFREEIVSILNGDKHFEGEIPVKSPDGGLKYLFISTSVPPGYEDNLEKVIVSFVDITEKKMAEKELINLNIELRELASHLLSVREEERQRIGREIHDDLGQQLTAIKMDVAWLEKRIQEQPQIIHDKFDNIITLLNSSNQSVRRILNELRPSILDDFSLPDAIQWHANQFKSNTGIPIEIQCAENFPRIPEEIATCIYRIFQEALTNITRHAKAKNVLTTIQVNANYISISIEDDGVGFDPAELKDKKTFGILGMKERVRSLKGSLDIASSPGNGTRINFRLPNK